MTFDTITPFIQARLLCWKRGCKIINGLLLTTRVTLVLDIVFDLLNKIGRSLTGSAELLNLFKENLFLVLEYFQNNNQTT